MPVGISACGVTGWLHGGQLAVFAGVILLVSARGVTVWLHGGRVAGADAGFPTGIDLGYDWLVAWWAD